MHESAPVRMSDLSARSPSRQLQRADDDRFAGASFARDGDKSRRHFPFQIIDQREVLDPEKMQNGAGMRRLRVMG